MKIKVIDVSAWDESIDWKKVKKTGIGGAILRCTSGSKDLQAKDQYFEKNYAGCIAAGIPVGVYRYSYAKSLADIRTEAEGVVKALQGKQITYPVFLDLEWQWQSDNLPKAQLGEFIEEFRKITEKAGYIFGVYANRYWFDSILPASARSYPMWVAHYGSEETPENDVNIVGWQYADDGSVPGIKGNVDMNVFYKDYNMKYYSSEVVNKFKSWEGRKEADGTFRYIIDTYNEIRPLPVGYKVKYTDEWCATAISAAYHACGYDSIFPLECSCPRMIEKAKKMGIWIEDDKHVPGPGEAILYDWQDTGKGDNIGTPDHIGMVIEVSNGIITVLEGNKGGAVARRQIAVGARYIRGFVCPKFDEEQKKAPVIAYGAAEKPCISLQRALNASYSDVKLKVTGHYNLATKNAVGKHELYNRPGKEMHSSHVSWLQEALNCLGSNLKVDEYFGPLCEFEVRKFQKKHGLKVDGIVGRKTTWMLIKLIRKKNKKK